MLLRRRGRIGYGKALGPELVPDPTFTSTDTWWEAAGWVVSGGVGTATAAASASLLQLEPVNRPSVVIGQRFEYRFVIDSITQGAFAYTGVGGTGPTVTTPGVYSGQVIATATGTGQVAIRTTGTTSGVVSSFSFKRVY